MAAYGSEMTQNTAAIGAAWRADGRPAVLVRSMGTSELGPRSSDDLLVVDATGEVAGALFRGAAQHEIIEEAKRLLADPAAGPRRLPLTVGFDAATAVGLTCGGTAELLLQRVQDLPEEFWTSVAGGRATVLVTDLSQGQGVLVVRDGADPVGTLGDAALDRRAVAEAAAAQAQPGVTHARVAIEGRELLIEVFNPHPRLVVVGAAAVADALTALVSLLGWSATTTVEVADAQRAIEGFGRSDVVIVTEHRPSIATPVLLAALQRPVGYVGALGSRRTRIARSNALQRAGASDAQLAALHCPTGLDLGARTPMESAISIVAEILAERANRDARPLRTTDTPITP